MEKLCVALTSYVSELRSAGVHPVTQDYKTYLDFVLAMENRKEPQVWRMLIQLCPCHW